MAALAEKCSALEKKVVKIETEVRRRVADE